MNAPLDMTEIADAISAPNDASKTVSKAVDILSLIEIYRTLRAWDAIQDEGGDAPKMEEYHYDLIINSIEESARSIAG